MIGDDFASVDPTLRRNAIAHRLSPAAALPGASDNVVLDCTETGRVGLRGPGTMDWLAAEGLAAPQAVNTVITLPCGTNVLRLGQQEVLLTAPPGASGDRLRELRQAWQNSSMSPKGYDAYRDEGWAWFVISGPAAPALMRRISMADLRPESLKPGQVAQTRALHLDVVIARLDRFGAVSYDIFFDIASAAFALDVLTETAAGLGAGFRLAAPHPAG
jgi:sarcosine oxidase subunit gamma